MLRNEPILFDAVDYDAYVPRPAVEDALLEAAEMSRGVLLVGPSGSGRTTTLNWLAGRLQRERVVARVDAALADSAAALLEAIRVGLIEALGGTSTAMGKTPALGQVTTEPVRLQAMVRELGTRHRAAILIDNLADPAVIKTVFGGLRELLWQLKYTFVCSARPQDLPVFLAPPADSFFRRRVTLTALTDTEIEGILARSDLSHEQASRRVVGVPRQPRPVIAALGSALDADFDAPRAEGVSSGAADVWRELVSLDRPASVTDEELRARSKLSPFTLRRHLNELVKAGLVIKLNERTGRPGRPTVVYEPRARAGNDA